MANHKSAIKRNRQSQEQRLRNRANKSKMKGAIKKVIEAIENKAADQAQEALRAAVPVIEKTAVKGSIHKKNASRRVSRLSKKVNALLASA